MADERAQDISEGIWSIVTNEAFLRDLFAGAALIGLSLKDDGYTRLQMNAELAYHYADAMLAARATVERTKP